MGEMLSSVTIFFLKKKAVNANIVKERAVELYHIMLRSMNSNTQKKKKWNHSDLDSGYKFFQKN